MNFNGVFIRILLYLILSTTAQWLSTFKHNLTAVYKGQVVNKNINEDNLAEWQIKVSTDIQLMREYKKN